MLRLAPLRGLQARQTLYWARWERWCNNRTETVGHDSRHPSQAWRCIVLPPSAHLKCGITCSANRRIAGGHFLVTLIGFRGLKLQAVFEKHNPFVRPLKKKGFKEERVTTIGWYDLGKSHDPGIQQEPTPDRDVLSPSRLSGRGLGSQSVHSLHSVCVSPLTGDCTRDLSLHGDEPFHR
jgi:hypothetical protein